VTKGIPPGFYHQCALSSIEDRNAIYTASWLSQRGTFPPRNVITKYCVAQKNDLWFKIIVGHGTTTVAPAYAGIPNALKSAKGNLSNKTFHRFNRMGLGWAVSKNCKCYGKFPLSFKLLRSVRALRMALASTLSTRRLVWLLSFICVLVVCGVSGFVWKREYLGLSDDDKVI